MKGKETATLLAEPVLQWLYASWLSCPSNSCNLLLHLKIIREVSQCDLLYVFQPLLCLSEKHPTWLPDYVGIWKKIYKIKQTNKRGLDSLYSFWLATLDVSLNFSETSVALLQQQEDRLQKVLTNFYSFLEIFVLIGTLLESLTNHL